MFYSENLTLQTLRAGNPWEFTPQEIPDEVRFVKKARQAWYQNPQTRHQFYTGFEPLNPNARIAAGNPAVAVHAFVVDLDQKMSFDELQRFAKSLPHVPTWLEISLGRCGRMLWVLDRITSWPRDAELSNTLLDLVGEELQIQTLPGLDKGSWSNTSRLYANGGEWLPGGGKPFSADVVDSLACRAAITIAKKSSVKEIELSKVEELIKAKWPSWSWPSDFALASQGPSWWVSGSTSPKSAIVHAGGMFTFSAHAEKSFYSWDDILGAGTMARQKDEKISGSIKDVFYDGSHYYIPREEGGFHAEAPEPLRRRLVVFGGISNARPKGGTPSDLDLALARIERSNRVDGAAPFIFRPSGRIRFNGKSYLNTFELWPKPFSPEPQAWGEAGGFPFISRWLGTIFQDQGQLDHFLSWLHVFYRNAKEGNPIQGQATFFCGGAGIGKTLLSQRLIGALMGGYTDASSYLMGADNFGGDLFKVPVWSVDDQLMASTQSALRVFTNLVKKTVANKTFNFHEKFRMKCLVDWPGRVVIGCNLDAWSQSILPALEDSIVDKVNFYRLHPNTEADPFPADFFPRSVEGILESELPMFARWVYDLDLAGKVTRNPRFGIQSFQHPELIQAAYQNSGSAGFQEILYQFLVFYKQTSDQDVWEGTTVQLFGDIVAIPALEALVRGVSITVMNRHLLTMASFPAVEVTYRTQGDLRVWKLKLRTTKA